MVFDKQMESNADLDAALRFVIGKIEEEARRSGYPLTDEQRFLLSHLPTHSELPKTPFASSPVVPSTLVPHDTEYEQLCALANTAYHSDLNLSLASALNWEFAAAVSKLNRHPMSWLLQWAGVKVRNHWLDRLLLLATTFLLVLSFVALIFLMGNEPRTRVQLITIGIGHIVVLIGFIALASRWVNEWQMKATVEECRRGSTYAPNKSPAGRQTES